MRARPRFARVVLVVTFALVSALFWSGSAAGDRISAFGRYSGYSEENDGWVRRSEYVPMADGTELAVYYFLPTAGGVTSAQPLPVILIYTRYLRAWEENGQARTTVDDSPLLQAMLRQGFALAVANARGTGASFGFRDGEFSAAETADSYSLVEWLAAQEWCDGNVGMWGRSYSGMTAYHAATQAPPHLRAVVSEMSGPVLYDLVYQGGVYLGDFMRQWNSLVRSMDTGEIAPPARVDADPDGVMRDAAVAEHDDNYWPYPFSRKAKYRNWSTERPSGAVWSWDVASSIHGAEAIRQAQIPIYHLMGWYDQYATQQALMYVNLRPGPQRLTIGPWTHTGGFGGGLHTAEVLRWFDYWLRGVDNGIVEERQIHYYLMRGNNTVPESPGRVVSVDEEEAEDGRRWKTAKRWPLRKARPRSFYLAAGPSGTVLSHNDGRLVDDAPVADAAGDEYPVDFSASMGSFSRWMDGYGAERDDPPGTTFFDERTAEDEKALTYTSAPFERSRAIVGYPVARLWVSSTAKDGDLFVYLEEIDAAGRAHYITEGMLRMSFHALDESPWKGLGLPFHRCWKRDRKRVRGRPVELLFDLLGTAIVIDAGHRIRVSVTGADAPHHDRYSKGPGTPVVTVHRDRVHPSRIELPMINVR